MAGDNEVAAAGGHWAARACKGSDRTYHFDMQPDKEITLKIVGEIQGGRGITFSCIHGGSFREQKMETNLDMMHPDTNLFPFGSKMCIAGPHFPGAKSICLTIEREIKETMKERNGYRSILFAWEPGGRGDIRQLRLDREEVLLSICHHTMDAIAMLLSVLDTYDCSWAGTVLHKGRQAFRNVFPSILSTFSSARLSDLLPGLAAPATCVHEHPPKPSSPSSRPRPKVARTREAVSAGGRERGASMDQRQVVSENYANPVTCFFHVVFKAAALAFYILFSLFVKSFVIIFVITVLLAALDFWVVKNVSGRILVGLRWWNEIDDEGNSLWKFECLDGESLARMNKKDSWLFWWALYLTAAAWIVLAIFSLIRFEADYLLVVGVCLSLSIANIVGFTKCNKDAKKNIQSFAQNALASRVTSSLQSAFGVI